MRSKLMTLLTVIGAVTVLVLAANTVALATTGKALLAGKINTSSKMTSIVRTTPGTGLQVKTKSTANAPFAVNGTGKVVNLNADKLDGLDSFRYLNQPYVINKRFNTPGTSFTVNATVPNGTYNIGYSGFFQSSPNAAIDVACYLVATDGTTTRFVGEQELKTTNFSGGVSGSGVLVKTSANTIKLECSTSVPAVQGFGENQPVQLVLTKVDLAKPLAGRASTDARIAK